MPIKFVSLRSAERSTRPFFSVHEGLFSGATPNNTRSGLQDDDLAVAAGWGNATKTSIMPGRGKVEEQPDRTLDIYLNANVAWRGIPAEVWRYTIGGYQLMRKWLSNREQSVLGHVLTSEEVREFQQMARRITAIISLLYTLKNNHNEVNSIFCD